MILVVMMGGIAVFLAMLKLLSRTFGDFLIGGALLAVGLLLIFVGQKVSRSL
jgi:hypothetical protein